MAASKIALARTRFSIAPNILFDLCAHTVYALVHFRCCVYGKLYIKMEFWMTVVVVVWCVLRNKNLSPLCLIWALLLLL